MARKVILKAPVPQALKDKVQRAASAREESEALIVREALDEYFARRPNGSDIAHAVAEDQAPYGAGQRPPPGTYPAVDALYQVIAEEAAKRTKKPGAGYARRDPAATPAPAPAD